MGSSKHYIVNSRYNDVTIQTLCMLIKLIFIYFLFIYLCLKRWKVLKIECNVE